MEKQARGQANPESSPTIQNVRVGDRLGIRYTGLGASFNIGEELAKSKTLNYPTFEAIYLNQYYTDNNGRVERYFEKILPNGEVYVLSGYDGEKLNFSALSKQEAEKNLEYLAISSSDSRSEMVIIPTHTSQSMVAMLPESSIEKDFLAESDSSQIKTPVNKVPNREYSLNVKQFVEINSPVSEIYFKKVLYDPDPIRPETVHVYTFLKRMDREGRVVVLTQRDNEHIELTDYLWDYAKDVLHEDRLNLKPYEIKEGGKKWSARITDIGVSGRPEKSSDPDSYDRLKEEFEAKLASEKTYFFDPATKELVLRNPRKEAPVVEITPEPPDAAEPTPGTDLQPPLETSVPLPENNSPQDLVETLDSEIGNEGSEEGYFEQAPSISGPIVTPKEAYVPSVFADPDTSEDIQTPSVSSAEDHEQLTLDSLKIETKQKETLRAIDYSFDILNPKKDRPILVLPGMVGAESIYNEINENLTGYDPGLMLADNIEELIRGIIKKHRKSMSRKKLAQVRFIPSGK